VVSAADGAVVARVGHVESGLQENPSAIEPPAEDPKRPFRERRSVLGFDDRRPVNRGSQLIGLSAVLRYDPGTYFWSIQTVDATYDWSRFAEGQTFGVN
jgi:hypothetical protein